MKGGALEQSGACVYAQDVGRLGLVLYNPAMRIKNIFLTALVVAFLLLIFWLAMQFTGEGNWTGFDFAVAGVLLFGAGVAYELMASKVNTFVHRAAVIAALGTALFLVWSNLAVGIIGSEDNPVNLMYIGVLAVFGIGALIANFRPHGMVRVLFATAVAQAVVTVIALIIEENPVVFHILAINAFFIALWVGSALLFQRANATLHQRFE